MVKDYSICVGTIGAGVWHSPDSGQTWSFLRNPFPVPLENPVRSLAVYPDNPRRVLAGCDGGLFRSDDGGATWEKLGSPFEGAQVWSLAIDTEDSGIFFAGIKPPAIYRRKGGRYGTDGWRRMPVDIAEQCEAVGPPRVNTLRIDPEDHNIIWAGIEADGVRRSLDGGATWARMNIGEDDIHDIAIVGKNPKRVLVSSPFEVFVSEDMGESWQSLIKTDKFPFVYARAMTVKEGDRNVVFLANSDGAVGNTGTVLRSTDGGKSWETLKMPVEPNSTLWAFATNPADPDLIMFGTQRGEVYTSHDSGDRWQKIKQEFGELRAVAWTPN